MNINRVHKNNATVIAEDISFVVRGQVNTIEQNEQLKKCTNSIRRYFPKAEIIISTWSDNIINECEYDKLVVSEQIEPIYMGFKDGRKKLIAANHQIVTTCAGINVSSRNYIVTMRADLFFNSNKFIKFYKNYMVSSINNEISNKILVLSSFSHRRVKNILYSVCDWFYFGLKKDIIKLFDIELMSYNKLKGNKINGLYLINNNFESEQYIFLDFIKRVEGIEIENSESDSRIERKVCDGVYSKYLIMLPPKLIGINSSKMPWSGYAAPSIISQGLFSYYEFKYILLKQKCYYIFYLVELVLWKIIYKFRNYIKIYFPSLNKNIVKIKRYLTNNTIKIIE